MKIDVLFKSEFFSLFLTDGGYETFLLTATSVTVSHTAPYFFYCTINVSKVLFLPSSFALAGICETVIRY